MKLFHGIRFSKLLRDDHKQLYERDWGYSLVGHSRLVQIFG